MKPIEMKLLESSSTTAWLRGRLVEEKALEYLNAQPGMRLLARNYSVSRRMKRGELDLVFVEKSVHPVTRRNLVELVFVEVRSRIYGENWETAEETLTPVKLYHLQTAMEDFLWKQQRALPFGLTGVRLDLLTWDGESFRWIRDVRTG